MGKFSELGLYQWEEEDLEKVDDEFQITEKNIKKLNELKTKLYWKAQDLIEEANRIESKADAIQRYIDVIGK